MTIASPEDVAARLGRELSDLEQAQAQALLDDAEALIRRRIPTLSVKAASDDNYEQVVVAVESSAVMRVLRNVSGINSESIGDYTISFSPYTASGALTITEAEWAQLGASTAAFTIRPSLPSPNPAVIPWRATEVW